MEGNEFAHPEDLLMEQHTNRPSFNEHVHGDTAIRATLFCAIFNILEYLLLILSLKFVERDQFQ